jgi:hypothetical protein
MHKDYLDLISQRPTAWRGHGEWAAKLVEKLKPKVTVDLGVDFGFSTFSFAYPNIGKVYGIDWFMGDQHSGYRDTYETVKSTYDEITKRYGIDNITFIKSDFKEAAKNWSESIDILHIDGEHSYESVSSNFSDFQGFLHDDSVVLFHDTLSFPLTVGKFFNELEGHKMNRTPSHGLGIWTKSKDMFDVINTL